MGRKRILTILISVIGSSIAMAQDLRPDTFFLRTDSGTFYHQESQIRLRNEPHFYFVTAAPRERVELNMVFDSTKLVRSVQLLPSSEFDVIDSLTRVGNSRFSGVVLFKDLSRSKYLRFIFQITKKDSTVRNLEYKLYPYQFPAVEPLKEVVNLYRGEEKLIPLKTTNGYNLKFDEDWHYDNQVEYRLVQAKGQPQLEVRSSIVGEHKVEVILSSSRPFLDKTGVPTYTLESFNVPIKVSPSRISYLNFDQQDYFYELGGSNSKVVKIDYSGRIELNKTYRIENQEAAGGMLVAELYTRSVIENENKILAVLRTYSYHREEEGYLYLKDGDVTRFFTNFNILPRPQIEKISILRQGKDWTTSLSVYPNDTVEIKIEGMGMEKSRISFGEGKFNASLDTARISDKARYYEIAIPPTIKESRIPISMNGSATSFELLVKEHQKPHKLNFVLLDYGAGDKRVATDFFDKPVLHYDEIKEINISFQREIIDHLHDFHGVQFLEVEIQIKDEDKRLLELKKIDNIKVVPSESSPRFESYNRSNASPMKIQISRYISRTLSDLSYWSSIELKISHDKSKYGGDGFTNYITIYRAVETDIDLQISFPAGLLSKEFGEEGIGNFTGISTAAQAQFTFYRKNQIAKQYPFKAGIGFIALNSLTSLNEDQEKDLGFVGMASFYPINSKSKVKFPLHAGFGYLFRNNKAFLLVGPGIQFNF